MADNQKLLEHFESENRESVEPVEEGLRAQVAAGECVAIRGELRLPTSPALEYKLDMNNAFLKSVRNLDILGGGG